MRERRKPPRPFPRHTRSSSLFATMLLRAAALSASRRGRHRICVSSSGSSSSTAAAAGLSASSSPSSTSTSSAPFSSMMPPCSFTPPPYTGPSASEVLRIRKEHLSPGERKGKKAGTSSPKGVKRVEKLFEREMPSIDLSCFCFLFLPSRKTNTSLSLFIHSDVPPLQGARHDHGRTHAVPL